MKHATQFQTGNPGFEDTDIRWRVESYLRSKHCPNRPLDIQVAHGVVTISGRISNENQREILVKSCCRVAGVLRLVDQLQVESASVTG